MRFTARALLGLVLGAVGVVWALQGLDLFPGQSFMNGRLEWTIIGAITIVAGLLLVAGERHRGGPR
jgi:sulfite exporter TauE/SafE